MEPTLIKVLPEMHTDFLSEKNVEVLRSAYMDNMMPALVLVSEQGEPLMTATVNLSGYGIVPSVPGNTFIKDYSENSGILDVLIENKVVSNPVRYVEFGFVGAHEVSILDNPLSIIPQLSENDLP